jgi:hypothetical protein
MFRFRTQTLQENLYFRDQLQSCEWINLWLGCECMYVIRTNIYLHVQITYKIFVQIPNLQMSIQ